MLLSCAVVWPCYGCAKGFIDGALVMQECLRSVVIHGGIHGPSVMDEAVAVMITCVLAYMKEFVNSLLVLDGGIGAMRNESRIEQKGCG